MGIFADMTDWISDYWMHMMLVIDIILLFFVLFVIPVIDPNFVGM